eukprot:TRINITY_DN5334_c0_g1_i3.p1 TRINITY_DN5334_c0_g1~~TRINITY_DN5334_c0_g1_i3.p1  ORF type:complete len:533 (-),score=72.19 TRINITY_DN5334_c0_g1_i3:50-1648(-)
MLNSRKGNLKVFQWEVEQFQRTHKEKMAAVTAVMETEKDNPYEQYKYMYDKRKAALVKAVKGRDIQRQNGLLVQRIAEIFNQGGYQRRVTQEFENISKALNPGQANRKMYKHHILGRYTMRKKLQTKILKENLQMVPNLKNAKHSISFARYEEEYQATRAHHNLACRDRTVGHINGAQGGVAQQASLTPCPPSVTTSKSKRPHVRTCRARSSSARAAADSSALGEPSISNLQSGDDDLSETRAPALATTGSNGGSPNHRVHVIQQRPRPAIAERHGGVRQVGLTSGGEIHRQFRPAQHTRPATGVRRGTGYMHQFNKISIKDAFEGSYQTASYTGASNHRAVRPASSPSKGAHHQATRVAVAASHSGYTHTPLATAELNITRVTGMPCVITNSMLRRLPSPRNRDRLASHSGSSVSKAVMTLSSVSGLARGEGSVAKTLRGFVLCARAAAPTTLFGQLEIPLEELQPWLRWHLRNFGGAQIPEHIQELQQLVAAKSIDSFGNYPDMLASFSAAARKQVAESPLQGSNDQWED